LDKVVEHAKSRGQEEVVGILIGRVEGQTVIVDDAITGRIESTATRAVLPPETIAKIADDIIKQRIQGTIVGWYHSHPGYGIFMSNVDISTQTRLQQFSQYVTAMIIDPSTDQVGFFTLDTSGSPQSIAPQHVHFFQEGEETIPPEFEAPIEQPPISPVAEEMAPPVIVPERRRTTRYLVIGLLLVGIMLGGTFGAIFLLPDRTPPRILHVPPTPGGWYGKQLSLNATVEVISKSLIPAKIAKVTLHYKLTREASFRRLDPEVLPNNLYNWTIPGALVKGDINYFFSASTTIGINVTEPLMPGLHTVHVADFSLKVSPEEWQIFAGKNYKFNVTISPLNHFQSPRMSLTVKALSGDFVFKWASGRNVEELSVSARRAANASLVVEPEPTSYGIHGLNLTAEGGSITHSLRFTIVVPSFEILSVRPSAVLSVSRTSARTATVAIAFRSLFGDIGVIAWSPPTLKGSAKPPELPYGVLPDRNASEIYLGKDEVKYVAFSFTVSPDTPSGSYEIVLSIYAVSCPVCRKELLLTLRVT